MLPMGPNSREALVRRLDEATLGWRGPLLPLLRT